LLESCLVFRPTACTAKYISFPGHLTSKSDVYSFGVVLLELMTGRRSMDKSRPVGEHNLVEWSHPLLKQKQGFHSLMDPKLGGSISMKGAQKVTQLARYCLAKDPKNRPLMSQVVEDLKSLPDLKDTASSSCSYQSMQPQHAAWFAYPGGSQSMKPRSSLVWNGQQPARSLSCAPHHGHASPYRPQASPYWQTPRSNAK
jgi:serine/threonine protein kinase